MEQNTRAIYKCFTPLLKCAKSDECETNDDKPCAASEKEMAGISFV